MGFRIQPPRSFHPAAPTGRFSITDMAVRRVLVYGFGPYRQFKDNVTQQIVEKLPRSRRLSKTVFPVRFNKTQFTRAMKRFRPDVVLGLGQCSRGRLLRIETRAVNQRRNHKRERGRPIIPGGAGFLPTTLRLEQSALGKQARTSSNAGDYVCNFSMYVILEHLRRHQPQTRVGFVHVPHAYDRERGVKFVRKMLKRIREGRKS